MTLTGGPYFPPGVLPPDTLLVEELTSAPNGGFNPWTIANAIHSSDIAFIGYIDGTSGNVEMIERDESTGTITGPTTLKAAMGADAHDSPATLILPSGNLLSVYCPHSGSSIYRRISTNPLDSTAWGSESNLDSSIGGSRYTNPQLHQLVDETNDPVYLFFRNEPSVGTDSRWQLSKSTDGGSTFGAMANIYHIPGHRSYLVSWSNGADRIDFLATAAFTTSPYKIGHFYYEGGSYFKSDGTSAGSPPIQDFANITQLHSGTDILQPGFVTYDGSGNPVVLFWAYDAGADTYDYYYGRWDGAAWTVTAFVTGTPAYTYNAGVEDGVYGAAIDDSDPDVIYGIKEVSGQSQLFRWVTADGGDTFTETQLTDNLEDFNAQVVPVRNRGSSLLVCWNGPGTWNHYESYSVGTSGLVASP